MTEKLAADHPDAGTINDPNVEDPYADLRRRNEAVQQQADDAAKPKKGKATTEGGQ